MSQIERPRLADQEDIRVPICVYCIMAFNSTAVHVIMTMLDEDLPEVPGVINDGLKHGVRTVLVNYLAGRPVEFVALLRAIGTGRRFRLELNSNLVGGFAEVEFFGTKVCVSHLYDAMEMVRNGRGMRWAV